MTSIINTAHASASSPLPPTTAEAGYSIAMACDFDKTILVVFTCGMSKNGKNAVIQTKWNKAVSACPTMNKICRAVQPREEEIFAAVLTKWGGEALAETDRTVTYDPIRQQPCEGF